jgi:hypothetical protein
MEKYSFLDFKKDIVEAGLESAFLYKDKIYDLAIVPGNRKLFSKKNSKPKWRLYNESDNLEIIRSDHETICDEIVIDGKKLEEIWDEVTIV